MANENLTINADRLVRRIAELAEYGKTPGGGVDRPAFSDADIEARRYVMSLMRHAGLNVRVDPVGNIFGRRESSVAAMGTILFGSHIDTVPNGGAYDGALGSLAAIEVAHTVAEAGYRNRHPLEVAVWCDEEGGLTGSRGFIGELSQAAVNELDSYGVRLSDKIRRIGGDPARVGKATWKPGSLLAYVELHVEQGSVLDSHGIDIGVVQGFVAIDQYDVTITGVPNHAGTTAMDERIDALLPAAELALAVDRIVRAIPGNQVGTVGAFEVSPGAPNVIPGEVALTVELRDPDSARLKPIWQSIQSELEAISDRHRVSFTAHCRQSVAGIPTDARLREVISQAAEELGLTTRLMPSGAGHDAQKLAQVCPTGMIFVPSVAGVSHCPRELTRPEDVAHGGNVLLRSVLKVDEW
ncbi:MAG: Zn-dependent hydrolase [Gemmatimonadota bacterium]|nr:MAG: Zn-dependent hydrolase [Gemmatimonadota bacterium]